MAFNPCCMPLQKGTKFLAIIDVVISLISLGLTLLMLVLIIQIDRKAEDITKDEWQTALIMLIVAAMVGLLQVLLAFNLYFGAKHRDYRRCRNWLIIVAIVNLISIIVTIVNLTKPQFSGVSFGGSAVGWVYRVYEVLVVYAFLKEMQRDTNRDFENPGTALPYVVPAYYEQNHAPPVFAYPVQQYPTQIPIDSKPRVVNPDTNM